MLLTQKASIEAVRSLAYLLAESMDLAHHHPDGAVRETRRELVELLTPVTKAWGTDLGVELTSLALQVHGGAGYIEETGVAQHVRDARIAPIYEGTNGIQAIDLVTRKLPIRDGAAIRDLLDDIEALDQRLAAAGAGASGRYGPAWPPVSRCCDKQPTGSTAAPGRCLGGRHALPPHVRHGGRWLADGPPSAGRPLRFFPRRRATAPRFSRPRW